MGSGIFNQSGGTHTVNILFLPSTIPGSGTYDLSGGNLVAGTVYLKDNGLFDQTGGTLSFTTFNQSGGTGIFPDLYVGRDSGSSTYKLSGGTQTVATTLYLGYDTGSSGSYSLSGSGSLSTAYEIIGDSGAGVFTQSGGTNRVTGNLVLGLSSTGAGSYNLSGANSLLMLGGSAYVGDSGGSGSFTQSGGSHLINRYLCVGTNANNNSSSGTGTYDLQSGSLTASLVLIGDNRGSGSFTQSGGTQAMTNSLYVGSWYFGTRGGGTGTYTQSGGSIAVGGYEYIGDGGGSGSFTQSGGSHLINYYLFVGTNVYGKSSSGTGTYDLQGGSLRSSGVLIGDNRGRGSFTQSGGTQAISGDLTVGLNAGTGTYTLSGDSSSLTVGGYAFIGDGGGSGTFTQSGGTHAVGQDLYVGINNSSGAYALSGGSSLLMAGASVYIGGGGGGSGAFTQSGGTHTVGGVGGNLYVGSNAGTGTYALSGGSSLLMALGSTYIGDSNGSGTFTQSGGTQAVLTNLYLGSSGGSGAYTQSGGSLSAGMEFIAVNGSGTFTHTGGTNTVSQNLYVGYYTGSGTYNLSSGSLRVLGTEYVGANGVFTHTGGTNTVNTLDLGGGGAYNLSGSGVLAAYNVTGNLTNAGTVNPGNSVGTMNVVGSYAQTAAGTLVVEIASAASYDKIAVTGSPGTATLAGTLQPLLLAGYRPAARTLFPDVITATGGVTGTFSSIYGGRQWLAIYHPNSVDLRYLGLSYADPALGLTRNQYGVGNMLDSVATGATGDLATVLNAIDNLPNCAAVGDAYQQISPEKAGALPVIGFADFYARYRGLAQRVTNTRFGGEEGGLALGPGGFNLNYSKASGLMLAYNSSSLAGLITGKKKEGGPQEPWGLYLEPTVVLGSRSGTANNTGYHFTTAGFTLGADYRVRDNFLVGLATGYSHTGANFKGSGGSVENNAWPILAYAAYLPNNFYAFGSLGYTLNLFDLNRWIAFDVISRTAKGATTGNQFNLYGETGYDLKCKRAVLTPMFSLAYSQIWVDGFTEDGADSLNLKVGAQKASSLQTGVGAKVAMPLKIKSCAVLPQAYATYQHEFSDNARGLDARLSQGSSTTTWTVERAGRDFAVVGGNLAVGLKKNLNLRLDYNAEVARRDYTAHNINVALRWQF